MANNTMTKLQTITVGAGGAASVTFSAIPQNYTDLVVKASARSDYSAVNSSIYLYPNGVNTNTKSVTLYANSSSTGSTNYSNIIARDIDGANATANTFSNAEFYIPNYTSANFKSTSNDSVGETNASTGSILMGLSAGLWSNTSAITSIALYTDGNFVQYSEFTLYGVYAGGITTPSAPTIASATDLGGGTAQVTISSPAAIPYTVTSSPGGITATGMSPIQISGLSPQTAYTFTAQAVAPFGVSAASSASSSVSMYNGMTALATIVVPSGGSSGVTFSSIPSGYSHLQVRAFIRDTTTAASLDNLFYRFNGDSGNNYANHRLQGDGGSANAYYYVSQSFVATGYSAASSATANVFGAAVIDILDYSNTNKYKTTRSISGVDTNGSGYVGLDSGVWMNTAAITSITLGQQNGGGVVAQYSVFTLYGVK
jgi:hypothetical protein